MQKVVLISCVSMKQEARSKVSDLYVSPLFKFNLKYARQQSPDQIFILSALHGLLPLDQEIDPYELTLNTMKTGEIKGWSEQVLNQLRQYCDLDSDHFTFLAGAKY